MAISRITTTTDQYPLSFRDAHRIVHSWERAGDSRWSPGHPGDRRRCASTSWPARCVRSAATGIRDSRAC